MRSTAGGILVHNPIYILPAFLKYLWVRLIVFKLYLFASQIRFTGLLIFKWVPRTRLELWMTIGLMNV